MALESLIIPALVILMVFGLGYAFIEPAIGEDKLFKRRMQLVGGGMVQRKAVTEAGSRRKQVVDTIREIEQRKGNRNKLSLEQRLVAAEIPLPKKTFIIACISIAGAVGGLLLILTHNVVIALIAMGFFGYIVPNFYITMKIKARLNKFLDTFPDAIETIVRGMKSGLPLGDCFSLIANEFSEPIRSEFRLIVEGQSVGMSVPEAVFRVLERVPLMEMSFFAIIIQIQYTSGGNLTDILQNLAGVIRERKRLTEKVKSLTIEAKISAVVIGAVPFFVTFVTYAMNPALVSLLWTTHAGMKGAAFSIGLIVIGGLIMIKIISIEV